MPDLFDLIDDSDAQSLAAAEAAAQAAAQAARLEAEAAAQAAAAAEAARLQQIKDIYEALKKPTFDDFIAAAKRAFPRTPDGDPDVERFNPDHATLLVELLRAFAKDPDRFTMRTQPRPVPAPQPRPAPQATPVAAAPAPSVLFDQRANQPAPAAVASPPQQQSQSAPTAVRTRTQPDPAATQAVPAAQPAQQSRGQQRPRRLRDVVKANAGL